MFEKEVRIIDSIIVGTVSSRFEFHYHRRKDFELFTDEFSFADDGMAVLL